MGHFSLNCRTAKPMGFLSSKDYKCPHSHLSHVQVSTTKICHTKPHDSPLFCGNLPSYWGLPMSPMSEQQSWQVAAEGLLATVQLHRPMASHRLRPFLPRRHFRLLRQQLRSLKCLEKTEFLLNMPAAYHMGGVPTMGVP